MADRFPRLQMVALFSRSDHALMLGRMSKSLPGGDATGSASALLSPRYRTWFVFVLLLLSVLNFADRAILSVLAQPIKEDLKLTDADLGMLQGLGFAILYSVLGLPIGWLAERVSRKGLIAACVAVWSFMTAACGFATNFATLLLGRVGVGIGEAGFLAAGLLAGVRSLHAESPGIGDVHRPARLAARVPAGPVGGWLGSFGMELARCVLRIGCAGPGRGAHCWLTLREPPRGLAEGRVVSGPAPVDEGSRFDTLVQAHLPAPAGRLHDQRFRDECRGAVSCCRSTCAASGCRWLWWVLSSAWWPSAPMASACWLGGFGFDRLSRRDAVGRCGARQLMLVLATPLYLLAFASPHVAVSFAFIWFANFAMATHLAPSSATVQNMAGPRMRAITTAMV